MLTAFLIFIPAGYMFYTMLKPLKPAEKNPKPKETFLKIDIPYTRVLGQNKHD
jgi:hypothetical protein